MPILTITLKQTEEEKADPQSMEWDCGDLTVLQDVSSFDNIDDYSHLFDAFLIAMGYHPDTVRVSRESKNEL